MTNLKCWAKKQRIQFNCFFEPAFNLQYLPTKHIFSDEQANHLAHIWALNFSQYLLHWGIQSENEEHELGIVDIDQMIIEADVPVYSDRPSPKSTKQSVEKQPAKCQTTSAVRKHQL